MLLWKKNDNIITVGDQILRKLSWREKVKLNNFVLLPQADSWYYWEAKENGNNLMISHAEPGDEGNWLFV